MTQQSLCFVPVYRTSAECEQAPSASCCDYTGHSSWLHDGRPVRLGTEGHLPVDAFVIVVAIKKLDLLKGLGAGVVAAEVRVHAQEQVEGCGAYERGGQMRPQPPTNSETRTGSGPIFHIHWEGLGKPHPIWSLSSFMSIVKDALGAGCKVYTQSCPITFQISLIYYSILHHQTRT